MELTEEDAYQIFDLPVGAPIENIVKKYMLLALEWFPERHSYTKTSLEHFQRISQALVVLYFVDAPHKLNPLDRMLTLDEMMSLFQFICLESKGFEFDGTGSEIVHDEVCDSFDEDDLLSLYMSDDGDNHSQTRDATNDEKGDKADKTLGESHTVQKTEEVAAEELIKEEKQTKKKAAKKKAQKKRRKERKKQEKSVQSKETQEEQSPANVSKHVVDAEEDSSDSEEDLDTTSAFVTAIARKKIGHNVLLKKEAANKKEQDEEPLTRSVRARQLGLRANEMANKGLYEEAVQLFSEAIKLDQKDPRFYSNRAFCHEKMENFDKALKDSEKLIQLKPNVLKGHFRKGKALSGLKRYAEAEQCFINVLKLDPDCEDASKELMLVRMCQLNMLTEMGFTKEQAEEALQKYGSVDAAIESLLSKGRKMSGERVDQLEDVFLSDEDDEKRYPVVISTRSKPSASEPYDIKMDPNNPEGHNSLWVGNVQEGFTEKHIHSLFGKYGEIISIKVMPEKFCAFINYKKPSAAGMAMRTLQHAEVCGYNLYIRFPNTDPPSKSSNSAPKPLGAPSKEECHYWRTAGCKYGGNCRFKHIREHKGIDLGKKK